MYRPKTNGFFYTNFLALSYLSYFCRTINLWKSHSALNLLHNIGSIKGNIKKNIYIRRFDSGDWRLIAIISIVSTGFGLCLTLSTVRSIFRATIKKIVHSKIIHHLCQASYNFIGNYTIIHSNENLIDNHESHRASTDHVTRHIKSFHCRGVCITDLVITLGHEDSRYANARRPAVFQLAGPARESK